METQKFLPTQFLQDAFKKFRSQKGNEEKFWAECLENFHALPKEEQEAQIAAMKQAGAAIRESVDDMRRRCLEHTAQAFV
jgi:hypothetical protein